MAGPALKSFGHSALVALGIASVTSLPFTAPLISPNHEFIYHHVGSATPVFLFVTLGFCLSWLLFTVLLWVAERIRWIFLVVWFIILLSLPYALIRGIAFFAKVDLPHGLIPYEAIVCLLVVPAIMSIVFALLWRRQSAVFFRHLQPFVEGVFQFTSLFGLMVLGNLFWLGWQARNLNEPRQLHQSTSASSASVATRNMHPRIIWLLLDELSFDQVYDHRFAGLDLPAFDQLAATSTIFTHVVPAGTRTDRVIPSLFTGIPLDDTHSSPDGQLRALHDTASGSRQPFDTHQTIFQDALDRGYKTALSGWFNPYCRILAPVLDSCFWTYRTAYPLWNVVAPAWKNGLAQEKSSKHIDDYQDLLAAGDALLTNPSLDFAFVHLPIPHPGAIYDRHRRAITTNGGSYIDNLAFADLYLAHFRQILEQNGQWNSSIVIVMGDHSWRTFGWRGLDSWTAEDELASHGGKFDDRPAYILKLPNQETGASINTRFAAKDTRALLDALLDNRLHTTADLQAWVDEQNP